MESTAANLAELDRLGASAEAFEDLTLAARMELLARLSASVHAAAPEWVRVCCEAKGIDPASPVASEEWLGGPVVVLRYLRLLRQSLDRIVRRRRAPFGKSTVSHRGPNLAVQVLPDGIWDKLLMRGFEAEVWLQGGMDEMQLESSAAALYLGTRAHKARTVAILGAGNYSSIGPLDVLTFMFVHGDLAALKLHPLNAYLRPVFEAAFRDLLELEFLVLLEGDAAFSEALVHDERVDAVHITGSAETHDAIVWGGPQVREANRATNLPELTKPITSELGCVTPILVVPGIWNAEEIRFQARNVASMVTNNASFNCNAAKLLLTAERWPQRRTFIDAVAKELAATPTRAAYYPGAKERFQAFERACAARGAKLQHLGSPSEGELPWLLARDLDFEAKDRQPFETEAWCSVLAEVTLNAANASEFIPMAIQAANERVAGNLSCAVLIDPRTAAEPGPKSALARGERDLEYGTIAINHWPGLSYGLGSTCWGAHPGNTLQDVGSGIGYAHNALMLPKPLKSIVRGPFVPKPSPLWVNGHARALPAARALADFEAKPGLGAGLRLIRLGLRG
jgi:acyl-CoA reductase-like NAD-dependent aldehyde dehydrogenase